MAEVWFVFLERKQGDGACTCDTKTACFGFCVNKTVSHPENKGTPRHCLQSCSWIYDFTPDTTARQRPRSTISCPDDVPRARNNPRSHPFSFSRSACIGVVDPPGNKTLRISSVRESFERPTPPTPPVYH
ncbi:unnamed protein product [Ectocarpus sp. 4 AP-2014]